MFTASPWVDDFYRRVLFYRRGNNRPSSIVRHALSTKTNVTESGIVSGRVAFLLSTSANGTLAMEGVLEQMNCPAQQDPGWHRALRPSGEFEPKHPSRGGWGWGSPHLSAQPRLPQGPRGLGTWVRTTAIPEPGQCPSRPVSAPPG